MNDADLVNRLVALGLFKPPAAPRDTCLFGAAQADAASGSQASVLIDGDSVASTVLTAVPCSAGDRVLMVLVRTTLIVIANLRGISDGWVQNGDTWTYASAATFTVPGNRTTYYTKGTKLRWVQSATTKYGVVASSSYSSPNTTVTIVETTNYVVADSAITGACVSRVEAPAGFPHWFAYTPTVAVGTWTNKSGSWCYRAGTLDIILATGPVTNSGSGLFTWSIPSGLSIDLTVAPASTIPNAQDGWQIVKAPVGLAAVSNNNTSNLWGHEDYVVFVNSATTVAVALSITVDRISGCGSWGGWHVVNGYVNLRFSVPV